MGYPLGISGMDYWTGLAMNEWLIGCICVVIFTAIATYYDNDK